MQLVYGGAGMQGGPLGDAWMFNVTAASWSSLQAKGSAPPPREMHSGTMVDDSRMLVFGGRGTDNRCGFTCDQETFCLHERPAVVQGAKRVRHSLQGGAK